MRIPKLVPVCGAAALLLAACGEPAPGGAEAETSQAPPRPDVQPAPLAVPPPAQASASPLAQSIDQAAWSEAPAEPQARRDMLIKAQVLLDRAHVSPGVIDGQMGENVRSAIRAFERAKGLPADGELDAEVWSRLTADAGPVMTDYVITEADVRGPFVAEIPEDYAEMAKLERLAYTGPAEALAERFHMGQDLLEALNPDADFSVAGTRILVAAPGGGPLAAKVARIEVDKAAQQVRAYGADDALLATYPATVGSSEMPTPSGEWAVRTVAPNPTWTYDPSRLTFGDRSKGKLTIPAGPNNPVGAVWIDLTKDTYGIHGAPEPKMVAKAASHGCVRLTNWDAQQLSKAVEKGTRVVFVGAAAARKTRA